MPTLLPSIDVVRLTNVKAPADASSHRSNVGVGEASALLVIRIVQVPLRGGVGVPQVLLSQSCTNTSLSPLTGSALFEASTSMAPSVVQTTPESTPLAAPITKALGLSISSVMLSDPLYQTSSQMKSLSLPVFAE